MFDKIRKMKNKKGFTLVELIVVLVILAILAALLVPALTGYIDKANQEKVIATTRQVVMAAQAEASEAYGKVATGTFTAITPLTDSTKPSLDTVLKLAEVKDDKGMRNGVEASVVINVDASGTVTKVVLTQSGWTCTYNKDAIEASGSVAAEHAGYTVAKKA